METLSKAGSPPRATNSRLLLPIKAVCFMFSVYSVDVIANPFKSAAYARAVEIREYLYFTNIGLLYTIFAVTVGWVANTSKFIKEAHSFSVATCLILEILVALIFWTLFLIDPFLVKNRSDFVGGARPSIINELPKHAFPLVILLIEKSATKISKCWKHRAFLLGFGIAYYAASEGFIAAEQMYLYPFLRKISPFQRFQLFAALSSFSVLVYELLFAYEPKAAAAKKSLPEIPRRVILRRHSRSELC
ncbi:hypothetical protein PAPHI01_1240 [Pancytospora philotis]|nr:hypothetical protein PAPHI01_1232 [Pancytospora philotis]KAI4291966.1 hypothetical protein PAPHI01_1240 [Pancytospora philotis]